MADARARAQITLINQQLKGVGIYPVDWEEPDREVDYMYRERNVLVRDDDEQRVTERLREILAASDGERHKPGGGEEPGSEIARKRVIKGLLRLDFSAAGSSAPTTPQILEQLDTELGTGVAGPDHVLHLCVHACPATEPEEVPPGTTDPFPVLQAECGCDCGHCPSRQRRTAGAASVSVVDTGLVPGAAQSHTWLDGVTGDREDPYTSKGALRSYAGHGTFVAGCVRAMAPEASVNVEGVRLSAGGVYETNVVRKLAKTLRRSPDIVVFTAATKSRLELPLLGFDALYESAIRRRTGLAVVVPADNDGTRDLRWPAAYKWTISVGALSPSWRARAHFSNHGPWVDVYAPGEGLVNAFAEGEFSCIEPPNVGVERYFDGMARWSGTSFSTPLVAGMIAARMSATGENANQAGKALLRIAQKQAIPGVGPVLLPDQAGRRCPECSHREHHCCHH